MTVVRRPSRGWLVLGIALVAWLIVDRPWSIRPMHELTSTSTSGPFDAARYVEGIWTSRVVPTIEGAAAALVPAGDTTTAQTGIRAVSLTGVVMSVDTSSRVGLALVDVVPVDGRADAVVQIGPVIRGTTLRDALDFIRFTDFANQLEFAAVSSALNDRVLSDVLEKVDVSALAGQRVRVVGVMTSASAPDGLPSVVPIRFEEEAQP